MQQRARQGKSGLCFNELLSPREGADAIVERIRRQVLAWLTAYGIPDPIVRLLLVLHQEEALSGSRLAALCHMTLPQLSLNIKELVRAGIVVSEPDADNRTRRRLSLTQRGQIVAEYLVEAREVAIGAALAGTVKADKIKIEQALRKRMNW